MGFEQVFDKVRGDIARVGWSAVGVFPRADEPRPVTFTYTIGLAETYGHPELIVYGLDAKQAHEFLWSAIQLLKEGTRFEHGKRYAKVLQGYDVEFRKVDDPGGHPLNVARAYYDREVEALQLIWPDADGRFPGDPDVDPVAAVVQVPVVE